MANRIKLKRSSVSGNAPTTGDIEVGEVALNMADQVIHYRDGSDNIKGIVHDPSSSLTSTQPISINASSASDFKRTSQYGSINLTNNASGNIASGQATGGLQWVREADDATAYTGFAFMDYDTTEKNGLIVLGYDDGVSGFSTFDITRLRKASAKFMNGELAFEDDGSSITVNSANRNTLDLSGLSVNTAGLTNTASTGSEVITARRGNQYGSLNISNNDGSALASGQATGGLQWVREASGSTCYAGFAFMDYDTTDGNGLTVLAYDDGVSTFGTNQLIVARAGVFNVMDSDVAMSSDGTNQTINTTGRLDIIADSGDTTLRLGGGVGVDLLTLNGAAGGTFYIQTVSNDGFRLQSPDGTDFVEIQDGEIAVNCNDLPVATFTDGKLATSGIENTGDSYAASITAKRNSEYGSINVVNNADSALASGQTTGGIQFIREGNDSTCYAGYQYMDYNSTSGNGFILKAYDDGVTGFSSDNLLVARAGEVQIMNADLTFSTDGTDQTITGAGDVKFDSVIQLQQLASDPGTATNGSMYYNTTTNRFRGYENGSWINLH